MALSPNELEHLQFSIDNWWFSLSNKLYQNNQHTYLINICSIYSNPISDQDLDTAVYPAFGKIILPNASQKLCKHFEFSEIIKYDIMKWLLTFHTSSVDKQFVFGSSIRSLISISVWQIFYFILIEFVEFIPRVPSISNWTYSLFRISLACCFILVGFLFNIYM